MSELRLMAADRAPEHLRPYLVGCKLPNETIWRTVAADGSTIADVRAAYDRGEVEITQGRGEGGVSLLYRIPRKKPAARDRFERLDAAGDMAKWISAALAVLRQAAAEGLPCPTNEEMRVALEVHSTSTPQRVIEALAARGVIMVERVGKGRVVTIVDTGARTAALPGWGARARKGRAA